jgi:hypothetical protein
MFLPHVEIELNCEPFAVFRWQSALGFHEWHLNATSGTGRGDGMRICAIADYQFRFLGHAESLRPVLSHR